MTSDGPAQPRRRPSVIDDRFSEGTSMHGTNYEPELVAA